MTIKHAVMSFAVLGMVGAGFTARGETQNDNNSVPVEDLTMVDEQGNAVQYDEQDQADDQQMDQQNGQEKNLNQYYRYYRYYRPYYGNYRYYRPYYGNYRYYRPYYGYYRYYRAYYGYRNAAPQNGQTENVPAPQVDMNNQ